MVRKHRQMGMESPLFLSLPPPYATNAKLYAAFPRSNAGPGSQKPSVMFPIIHRVVAKIKKREGGGVRSFLKGSHLHLTPVPSFCDLPGPSS